VTLDAEFGFTTRVRPFVEVGVGDARFPADVGARWDVARFDDGAGSQPSSFWASSVNPSWLDVTCYTHQWSSFIGRHRVTDRFGPGTLTLVAKNEDGWADLDPDNVTELPMRPGRQLRVGVHHEVFGQVVLWRGFVDAVMPGYDPELADIVTVEAVCALGEVSRQKLPELAAPVGAGESGSARIIRILDAALWPDEPRDIPATGVAMVATTLGGQVADQLGQVAESEGGAVYGDLDGRVAYRGRDWQTFDAGTAPDNVIGNVVTETTPGVPAYLMPLAGVVSTPDPGPPPPTFTIVTRLRGCYSDGRIVAGQMGTAGQYSWALARRSNQAEGQAGWWDLQVSADGTGVDHRPAAVPRVTGDWEYLALTVTQNVAGQARLTSWRSRDGLVWTAFAEDQTPPAITLFDTAEALVIGSSGPGGTWDGEIAWVELRDGGSPTDGTIVWRFDAAEVPLGAIGYTDSRGRTWTLAVGGLIGGYGDGAWGDDLYGGREGDILLGRYGDGDWGQNLYGGLYGEMITPAEPAAFADICPTGLEVSQRRSDLVTQALLGIEGGAVSTYNDDPGQAIYGIETYETTDLLCSLSTQVDLLATRLFRTRGYKTAPRIQDVGFNAARGDRVVDLMATATPLSIEGGPPTRLRCRFARSRGRVIDRQTFVAGIEHAMSRDEWTCRMILDLARPFEIPQAAARWNVDRWNQSNWAPVT
jgi:hypothetical protein